FKEAKLETLLVGIACGLIGCFVGHWLAIGRDRRKEHNDVIYPLKQKILTHLDALSEGNVNYYISEDDIKPLRLFYKESKYQRIKHLHDNYQKIARDHMSQNDYGEVMYSKAGCEKMAIEVTKLNKILRLK
ncbi:hypothetical protein EFU40_18840, partial [Vibrio cholerae]|nr:hypothetical protein [Vibrio cholerae]